MSSMLSTFQPAKLAEEMARDQFLDLGYSTRAGGKRTHESRLELVQGTLDGLGVTLKSRLSPTDET